uniref:Uncharacterized protein n=1 Tax=Opuntia streptacantha TaxID=393608 RepID=A0A7C9DHU4_OPUST
MKPLEPKPPDPCLLAFPALSWDPPNHDSSLNLLWAETRSQSCSNCSDVDGYSLSCSDLVCNRVGICCASVLAHRQARLLKAKPLKPSIAFIVVLIAPFESVGRVFDAAILFSFNVEESPMCMGSCCCPEPSVAKGQLLLVLGHIIPSKCEGQRAGLTLASESTVQLTARSCLLRYRLAALLECIIH